MALKLKNPRELNNFINKKAVNIEEDLIYALEYLVADLLNHAKLSAGYEDQTSNLKSSIGGAVLKDGVPVTYRGFIKEGPKANEGPKTGEEFLNSLLKDMGTGYMILIVAGMEYATYVENKYELNVLATTEDKMRLEMQKTLDKLKSKIK